MYFQARRTAGDFLRIVKENRHKFNNGVVHSFTGDVQHLKDLLDLGLYIGISGSSLKTKESLEVVSKIPLDRILVESAAPHCDIRAAYASFPLIKTKFPIKKFN